MKKLFFARGGICLKTLIVLMGAIAVFFASSTANAVAPKPPDVDYYTCTMHPSVRSQDPDGKCPICGMNLVPVKKKSETGPPATNEEQPTEFTVPVERQQQIGVTYATVGKRPFHCTIRAAGLVESTNDARAVVTGQYYQDDLPLLKKGLPIKITVSSYPGEAFSGRISLIAPTINDITHTIAVQIEVQNPGAKLRPGMYVDVELALDLGEGLAVPVSAVLPTGLHNIAFVDKGGGRLQPRYLELGGKFGDFYEVKSGLQENERVVNSANFLIDAEAQVQGALKGW
jgi:multidrug efflux pump subunit AcrA (membrane-fusion protein)